VVDDSEDTRDIIGVVLTAAGFEVLTATNGLEAIVAAHNVRPAVIVIDANMPVLNGIEATRLLKQHLQLVISL
jgi:two-component system chemotaxis response regulator CheB